VELRNESGTMIRACRLQSVTLRRVIALPVSVGNLIRLASEAESRNVSGL